MAQHRAYNRTSTWMAPAAAATTFAAIAGLVAVPAQADDVDELIARMETVSHDAGAKNEEVKQLELDIDEATKKLDQLADDAAKAHKAADEAKNSVLNFQGEVDGIAVSKYRNVQNDPLVTTLESGNPQTVIDRAAYLGALSRNAERTLGGLQDANSTAAQRATDANIALAEAEYLRNKLDAQHKLLDSERKDLEEQVRELEEQVNSLSDDARDAWEDKNGPVEDPNPETAGSGVGGSAVAAAMSRLGSPYGWGATGPNQFDCSGLMYWAYQQQGKTIPRTSGAQIAGGTPVSLSDLQPGDIIGYYSGVSHVGMYIGNGQIVHASDYGIPVQVVRYDSMPIQGAVRY